MSNAIPFGKKEIIDGQLRVYYYGYWVKAYPAPADTLLEKKRLIDALTRRLFDHVEHGLNVPGPRLEEARRAYNREDDPERRRVKGGMLAGCLFNRATDIFKKLVELQALGVRIGPENELMRECGDHLQEALTLGRLVLHRSGEEGLDELWGEPFKAFCFPIEDFYNSRYIKIAQSMEAIDAVRDELVEALSRQRAFAGFGALAHEFARAARVKCETLRTDEDIFDVWTSFVVAGERMLGFAPACADASAGDAERAARGLRLVTDAKNIISYITRARVPMPKTTREFVERCAAHRAADDVVARSVA